VLATAIGVLARLCLIWQSSNVSIQTKIRLLRAIVISTAQYWCETWTMMTELEVKIRAFELRWNKKLLRISYTKHKTNKQVGERYNNGLNWRARAAPERDKEKKDNMVWSHQPHTRSCKYYHARNDWWRTEEGKTKKQMARQYHPMDERNGSNDPQDLIRPNQVAGNHTCSLSCDAPTSTSGTGSVIVKNNRN